MALCLLVYEVFLLFQITYLNCFFDFHLCHLFAVCFDCFYGGLLFVGMYHTLKQGQSLNQILRFHGYLGKHLAPFENCMSFVILYKTTKREYNDYSVISLCLLF